MSRESIGTEPKVTSGGLVTVAFLKARIDESEDHVGIFMPLIYDVIQHVPVRNFAAADVQVILAERHGVVMPQETVLTLLKRATRKQLLVREAGRFHLSDSAQLPRLDVAAQKALVEQAQLRLAAALQVHAHANGVEIADAEAALQLLISFLESQQVALILGVPGDGDVPTLSRRECDAVARFLLDVVPNDPGLASVLKGILEGLVLYHAAFLPDLPDVSRKFTDLTVVFDSVLVRRALGYEGTSPQALLRDTVDLFQRSGIRCVVFDKTVNEIERILRMYQDKLATSTGRASLRPTAMARHFLSCRYSPSDVQEMSAVLDEEIGLAGFRIIRTPTHIARHTYDEATLAARLADPKTHDVLEPRVQHDVDCVAGVLTLRRGHATYRIEDARFVFATASPLVLKNTRLWWEEDENETGVPPMVDIRALANLAWLKKPSTASSLQLRDLVALCAAAMRPTQRTWQRFLSHLDKLQASQRLTADQATAIIVSAASDRLLREAEVDEEDLDDVDAGTLDEIVDRVIADYTHRATADLAASQAAAEARVLEADARATARSDEAAARAEEVIAAAAADAESRIRSAEALARSSAEILRRRDMVIEGRSRRWAHLISSAVYWPVTFLILTAALVTILKLSNEGGWLGALVTAGFLVFVLMETAGILGHVRAIRLEVEARLRGVFHRLLAGDLSSGGDSSSLSV